MSSAISSNLNLIQRKIDAAYKLTTKCLKYPTLVAVSKLKPIEDIIEAYRCGVRHFGENYIQELDSKSNDVNIIEHCPDIKWHYIGAIQKKHITKFLKIRNLECIQSMSDQKYLKMLNDRCDRKLKVMIQVNTSGEIEKQGITENEVVDVVKYIIEECKSLIFVGLMTIGQLDNSLSDNINKDFLNLLKCRDEVSCKLGIDSDQIELSMGMSNDFEQAIILGSTLVRIGSSIFGARPKKEDFKM